MADSTNVIDPQEYEEVPEEVVETSFMCGECFLLFPTTEDFNAHQCHVADVDKVEDVAAEGVVDHKPSTSALDVPQSTECVHIGVWEPGESEAAMEEAVASILGERMKRMAPQGHPVTEVQLGHSISGVESESVEDPQVNPILDHTVEESEHLEGIVPLEAVEIPTTNLYMYDNPVYLNRLMKDNTFGRRVRHDAPYSHRLGPWDNKSSQLLIQLLGEYPKAYFILDKQCKRTEAWELIRIKLAEAGYQFTVLQIRMRWRELCKMYRNTVNHNDMFDTKKTCQFFGELNILFGVWDHPATLLLIRQLEANGGKPLGQNGGTRMRIKVWEHIRQVLASHGYKYTPNQVQGRWSNLVTLYQRMVENNARPDNEPITIAYKDHIERIFNYVPERNSKWLKIMEKRGKTPKAMKKKWTLAMERRLLTYYHERVYQFNNSHVDNSILWKEIVQKLEEHGYDTTVEKVRVHFYELTKQFSMTELHNSQPGTIRRECKHHKMLSEIYSIFNFWPHDKSSIKMEKTNTLRMRQVNAQLMWSEDQSRTLLQLYPQILVSHFANGDHQPMEELWLQLAKAYMNAANDRKQCYEIEEHIAVLRRGYHSHNPFPFVAEMQLVEETESTLGFTLNILPGANDQLVSYWSHGSAHLLLDLVIHHRQEGVKNNGLFEVISKDLADFGYRYTGEECRVYYSLLRQLYNNRLRTIRRNKELIKPFPYMDKMAEVDGAVSQPKFTETPENRLAVLNTASSKLKELKRVDGKMQKEHIPSWLVDLKMSLKHNEIFQPLPSVMSLAGILSEAIEDTSLDGKFVELNTTLGCNLNFLKLISEKGISAPEGSPTDKCKDRKTTPKSNSQPKYGSVQWTEKNLLSMLMVIKEWKLLCHDDAEVKVMLSTSGHPLWKEVAFRVTSHYKVDPKMCYEQFTQLCREYKSVMTFNARLVTSEGAKSVICQDMLGVIMSLHCPHDAQLDSRDTWWKSEEGKGWRQDYSCDAQLDSRHMLAYYTWWKSDEGRDWSQDETLELIFAVREVWSSWPEVKWDVVVQMMACSGYKRCSDSSQEKFQHLYEMYQSARKHNKTCNMRTRRRPPFYYKLRSFFGDDEGDCTVVKDNLAACFPPEEHCIVPTSYQWPSVGKDKMATGGNRVPPRPEESSDKQNISMDKGQVLPVLVRKLKSIKVHQCHSVPRRPLLLLLAQELNECFQCTPPIFSSCYVWELLVHLHQVHYEAAETNTEVQNEINLRDLWEKDSKPLVAYGLLAVSIPGWEKVRRWNFEEMCILMKATINWTLQQLSLDKKGLSFPNAAAELLKAHGYEKTTNQCADQLMYVVSAFKRGGYKQFTDQINLIHMLAPQLINMLIARGDQNHQLLYRHQTPEIPSSPEAESIAITQSSKKLRLESQEHSTHSSNDEVGNDFEASVAENVTSYVKINVSMSKNKERHHGQSSSDALKDNERLTSQSSEESSGIPQSRKSKSMYLKNANDKRSKCMRGMGKVKKPSTSHTSVEFSTERKKLKGSPPTNRKFHKSPQDLTLTKSRKKKVQVEVLSITENDSAKVIECKTVAGITPSKTLKLHYPPSNPVPPGVKHLHIPWEIIHPDTALQPESVTSKSSITDTNGQLHFILSSPVSHVEDNLNREVGDQNYSKEKSSALVTDACINSEKDSVLKLLHKYSQECQQENLRLFTLIQESNQEHISVLKEVFSVLSDIKMSL